ncbi:MAG: 3-deoxy-D-manno-octulosonic acid transferase [Alphaproteobacteria bacterium]|nr:3-deoxy-D-manno-octulosonic acid transferase [Alphaproteobacteria bacterium]
MNLMSVSLYRAATYVGYPLIAAYLAVRKARGKEDLARFGERMGFAAVPRPEGRLVWLHGASVGETLSMLPLIQKIQELYPSVHILVTSGTVTSAQLMEKRLSGSAFHQYVPIDCMPQVRRFVDHWKPDLALWLESEFWPNILTVISERKIPLVLIHGRVSDKSFERWKKMPRFSHQLQKMFVKSFGQTQEDADRLKEIGAENTACVGNIKFAAAPLPVDEDELKRMKKQIGLRACWTAGSTHAGEDEIIANTHKTLKGKIPDILTIIAPRHPNRADEIEDIFKNAGLKVARRSRKEEITKETDIYLADTIGEMGLFYRLGEAAFVGGSMIPFGGQNIIEPARLGKAVLCGRYMMNFREIVARAKKVDALFVAENEAELGQMLIDLLTDKKLLVKKQKNAQAFAEAESNVLERLMPELEVYLNDQK